MDAKWMRFSLILAIAGALAACDSPTAPESADSGFVTNGNIQADKARLLRIEGGRVLNGDVQAVETVSVVIFRRLIVDNGNIQVLKSQGTSVNDTIVPNGDIQVEETEFGANVFANNAANGNLQVNKNTFTNVFFNTVGGDIQCVDNVVIGSGSNVSTGGIVECP